MVLSSQKRVTKYAQACSPVCIQLDIVSEAIKYACCDRSVRR